MKSIDLSIIIVNWNSGSYLKNCIKSVLNSDFCQFKIEIIVVDNASTDNSTDFLTNHNEIRIFRNKQNIGFGAACNLGVAESNAEYILFLNPDVELSEQILCNSLKFMKQNSYSVIGIKQINEHGEAARTCARKPRLRHALNQSVGLSKLFPSHFKSYKMTEWNHENSSEVDHVIGSFYLISKKEFNDAGGFDPQFFLYYEDYDLSLRIRKRNGKILYRADESIYHKGGGSSQNILARRLFLSQKSKLLFFKKHFSTTRYFIYFVFLFFVEFFIRLASSVVSLKGKEFVEIIKSYSMLIKSFKKNYSYDN